jgi:hypothetical protein
MGITNGLSWALTELRDRWPPGPHRHPQVPHSLEAVYALVGDCGISPAPELGLLPGMGLGRLQGPVAISVTLPVDKQGLWDGRNSQRLDQESPVWKPLVLPGLCWGQGGHWAVSGG